MKNFSKIFAVTCILGLLLAGCESMSNVTSDSKQPPGVAEAVDRESGILEDSKDGDTENPSHQAIRNFQDTGFSSGPIEYVDSVKNSEGERLEQYSDNKYIYTISADGEQILNGKLIDLEIDQEKALTENEVIALGDEYAKKLFPILDWNSSKIEIVLDEYGEYDPNVGISFTVYERMEDALISSNIFGINGEGMVWMFTQYRSSPSLIQNVGSYSEEQIKEIALRELLKLKSEFEESMGKKLPGDSIEDFAFIKIEKAMPDNRNVAYIVDVKSIENWGEINAMENYFWRIVIDAESGKVVQSDTILNEHSDSEN